MRELSRVEVEQVSGGVGPILGAALGMVTYAVTTKMAGESYSARGFVGSAVAGAVTFGFSAIGIGAGYSMFVGGVAGGAAGNAATHYQHLMQGCQ